MDQLMQCLGCAKVGLVLAHQAVPGTHLKCRTCDTWNVFPGPAPAMELALPPVQPDPWRRFEAALQRAFIEKVAAPVAAVVIARVAEKAVELAESALNSLLGPPKPRRRRW